MRTVSLLRIAALLISFLSLTRQTTPLLAETPGKADGKSPTPSSTAAAHAAAKGDPLLEALLTELDRSTTELKMERVQRPYYLEYRVHDVEDFSTEAAFGALREDQHTHIRVLRVVVRIGDYKQDSYY